MTDAASEHAGLADRDGVIDLLGLLAYAELVAFFRLSDDAALASSLDDKAALGRMAVAEFSHFERIRSELERLGADADLAMQPFTGPLDAFHVRTAPADWLEGLVKAYVGDGIAALLMKDGKDNGFFHENYEFLHTNGQWYLLTTDYLHNREVHDKYDVQAPYLYALEPRSHWLKWTQGYTFDLPQEKSNEESIANAAAVYDWRKYDGYYYLIYAGRNDGQAYAKRGWNRIALARSKDLIHWSVPGK